MSDDFIRIQNNDRISQNKNHIFHFVLANFYIWFSQLYCYMVTKRHEIDMTSPKMFKLQAISSIPIYFFQFLSQLNSRSTVD